MRRLIPLLLAAASVSLVPDAANAQRARGVSAPRITETFNRTVRPGTRARSTQGMARQLRGEVGKNRVVINTPRGQQRVDLAGSPHFDKATGRRIPTPHVHTVIRGGPKTTRPATKGDIRNARRVFRTNQTEGRSK